MKLLNLSYLENIDHIVTPDDFDDVDLLSSALTIFTDFKKVKPLVIDASTKAAEAQLLMRKSHVNLKIVLNEQNRICGIVNSFDVSEEQLIKLVTQGESREDILVTDVMQPRSSLKAMDFDELKAASVGNVIKTLEVNALQHCLVVNHNNHEIRGIISARDIARKLHIILSVNRAPSFADIFNAVHP